MERLRFIDGLRGTAALAVAVYHLAGHSISHDERGFDDAQIISFLRYGVQVFFVVSGFALRLSIGDDRITGKYALRFALRRSLRIDPPYWLAIATIVAINALIAWCAGTTYSFPSGGDVIANLTYTQGILGRPHISSVFWTLCIEVQFYALLLVLLWLSQRIGAPLGLASLPLLLLSLCTISQAGNVSMEAPSWKAMGVSVLPNYAVFYLGTAAADFHVGKSRLWLVVGLVASVVGLAFNWTDQLFVGVVTVAAVACASRYGKMGDWLSSRPIQFFGRISYSLYLTHCETGLFAHLAIRRLIAPIVDRPILDFLFCISAATLAAAVFYYVVERPSLRLAKMIRLHGLRIDDPPSSVAGSLPALHVRT